MKDFFERILSLRNHFNLSQEEFARLIGISPGYLSKVEDGQNIFSRKVINRIVNEFGAGRIWLETGEGQMLETQAGRAFHGLEDYVFINVLSTKATAGQGEEIEEEKVIDALAFKRSWINNELHAQQSDLFLIYMKGDSMEPTLHPNDIILIDQRENEIVREGVYVLRIDNSLLVKRLQKRLDGSIDVTSDNPFYKPMRLDLNLPVNNFQIIGRVVWIGRRI